MKRRLYPMARALLWFCVGWAACWWVGLSNLPAYAQDLEQAEVIIIEFGGFTIEVHPPPAAIASDARIPLHGRTMSGGTGPENDSASASGPPPRIEPEDKPPQPERGNL